MAFSVPHSLSQEAALLRIKELISKSRTEYGNQVSDVKEDWKGTTGTFSLTVRGYALAGTITVLPSTIEMEGEVPWALTFMKGTIEKTLKSRAEKLLK